VTKRTSDETRRLLLDTALQMLFEQGPYVGVTHIRLSDVVTRASFTTGAAYRVWENQDAFHRDLAVEAVRWKEKGTIDDTVAAIHAAVDAGLPAAEMYRAGAAANLRMLPGDAAFLTSLALRMVAPADKELTEVSHERHEQAMDEFVNLYRALLDRYDRQMREPYTVRHLAMTLAALSEGFAIQGLSDVSHPIIDRHDVDPGVGTEWTLFGCAAQAVVEGMTEPQPPA
jgi:AcrR family transcriptional regulator